MPDLGLTALNDVCEEIRRITQATDLPLPVDADTGGGAFMSARTIKEMTRAGAAGCHLEDQVRAKRCGHRPGKELVSTMPVLANLTEFGKTPLLTDGELRAAGVRLALYPLSAFRAMNRAATAIYATLRAEGTQRSLTGAMQTPAPQRDLKAPAFCASAGILTC